MKPFTLTSDDYAVIYDTALRSYKGGPEIQSKVIHEYFAFLKCLSNNNFMHFSDLEEILQKREFEKIPPFEIKNLKDFHLWPRAAFYQSRA